jgi:hypothetical protein
MSPQTAAPPGENSHLQRVCQELPSVDAPGAVRSARSPTSFDGLPHPPGSKPAVPSTRQFVGATD